MIISDKSKMLLKLEHEHHPCNLASLKYGSCGPSCQQVCLISEPDGQTSFIGLTFISFFSKDLSSLINDFTICYCSNQISNNWGDTEIPVHTGEAVSDGFENLFSVGVADDNVNAEDNKKDEVLKVSVTWKSVRILLTFNMTVKGTTTEAVK